MALSSFPLEGRVALVTGAGGVLGMGRATALAFADAGADVVVTDLIVKGANWDLEGTAEEIRKLGRRALAVKADVSKESHMDVWSKRRCRSLVRSTFWRTSPACRLTQR